MTATENRAGSKLELTHMDEDADEMRNDIQEHLSAVMFEQSHAGEFEAKATPDTKFHGNCLVRLTADPSFCEERKIW